MAMIIGGHSIIYSKSPEADRAFLRDVLKLPHVDVGEGWLIFGLPPAEVAVHPSDENNVHEFFLMCDDVSGTAAVDHAQPGTKRPETVESLMAELKTKINTASVADYLNSIKDEAIRQDCWAVVDIMKAATQDKPRMWGASIVGFGQ